MRIPDHNMGAMNMRKLRKDLEALSPDKLRLVEKFVAYLERKSSSKPNTSTSFNRQLARRDAGPPSIRAHP